MASSGRDVDIVMFAQDFPPLVGGIQTYAHELALRFRQRARTLRVVAPAVPGAGDFDASSPLHIERVVGAGDCFAAAGLPKLRGIEGAVTFHTQWPSAAVALAARRFGGRFSVCVAAHGRELLLAPWARLPWAQRRYDAVRRRAFSSADSVFAVSRYTAGLARELGVLPERIRVHGNGTDAVRFAPRASAASREQQGLGGAYVFLCVARLVARKGVDRVLAAFARLNADSARLVVVGDGPERAKLERRARELGVLERVRFLGKVPESDLADHYAMADAFVLPAASVPPDVEGFGIAFLEASASGLPVIGPDSGGPVDAIEHGVTGLCVDPFDLDALTSAMRRLIDDPAGSAALGAAGRKRVLATGTWDAVADALFAELSAVALR